MKKLIFVFGLMLSMVACSGNKTTEVQAVADSVADTTLVDSATVDTVIVDSID